MARPLVLSNGSMHVGINNYGLVHDFYYPYVGSENHATGESLRHKVGVWIDGHLSWLDDGSWTFRFSSAVESLVGHVKARHESLEVLVEFDDFVDATENIFLRNIHIVNLSDTTRDIRLFMHQAFIIGDSHTNTDTAQYLPSSDAILHYRGDRCFIIGGTSRHGTVFDQHSIGLFGIEGREGTYMDAIDGELENGNVEHGRVDSTLRFCMSVHPHSSERVQYWIAAGTDVSQAISLHKIVQEHGLDSRLRETLAWWRDWTERARDASLHVPKEYRQSFIRSVVLIKSHIDNNGAVIASTDSGMLHHWRDAYAYCWPRDGAYAIWPLIRMGYRTEAENFFAFCKKTMHASGYLSHKYRADGALGSSWHPYVHGDVIAPPIQEDETAITVFLFCEFYTTHPDTKLIEQYYESMIVPMAQFLCEYVDDKTHLPKPSYDLWEEVFLTTTYTTSVVHAALVSAASLAESVGDNDNAVSWRAVAEDMQTAAMKLLFDHKEKQFRKGILASSDSIGYHDEIDVSSFYGAFMYGLLPATSSELRSMYEHVVSKLGGGSITILPRYQDDRYMRPNNKKSNAWFITTLWVAQYAIEIGDIASSHTILSWAQEHMSATGTLAEQIAVDDEQPVSVSPLTWSHAEYVSTLLDLGMEATT